MKGDRKKKRETDKETIAQSIKLLVWDNYKSRLTYLF
jgi:hypothetical protein